MALLMLAATVSCSVERDRSITVSGIMVSTSPVANEQTGLPISGRNVLVDGRLVVTDSAGRFEVEGVVPPYDIAFDAGYGVELYEDVTRADPTCRALVRREEPYVVQQQRFVGTVSPAPVTSTDLLTYVDGYGQYAGLRSTPPSFDLPAGWVGPTADTLRLAAVAFAMNGGELTGFESFGSIEVPAALGTTASGLVIPMSPVNSGIVSGTVTAPPDVTWTVNAMLMDDGNRIFTSQDSAPDGTFSFVTLATPDGAAVVSASGDGGTATAFVPPFAVVALDIPAATRITSETTQPIATGTLLTWEAPADAEYSYVLRSGGFVFHVGVATSFEIPNLALVSGSAELHSFVELVGMSPGPTADELLAPAGSVSFPSAMRYSYGSALFPFPQ